MYSNLKRGVAFLAGCFLLIGPHFVGEYWLNILTTLCINAILIMGFSLIASFGRLSFAHIPLMAVGAYTTALLSSKYLYWSFWITLPLGGLTTALVALSMSYPVLRTKGVYFFLSTFAAGEAVREIFIRFRSVFGGYNALPNIVHPQPLFGLKFDSPIPNYYLILSMAVICGLIIYRLRYSRIGQTIKAIGSSDTLCQAIGINTLGYEILIFCIGSFFAGIAGVLFAHYHGVISPAAFGSTYAFQVVTWALVGGVATFTGPLLGLALMTLFSTLTRNLEQLIPLIYGLVIIAVILFRPGGLSSFIVLMNTKNRT